MTITHLCLIGMCLIVSGVAVALDSGQVTGAMGLPCTDVMYYDNGSLEFCRLAREATVSGQVLPVATGLHFTPDGVFDWCFLPKDTEIQGIVTRGHGHDFMTEFHPNGKLRRAYLANDQLIQGIPCARFRFWSAIFWPIHGRKGGTDFYDNGQLGYCELSEAIEIDGIRFKQHAPVRFDRDGKLVNE